MAATHALHTVHSGKNAYDAANVAETNEQSCSNCQSRLFSLKPAFYCQLCEFVLCLPCDNGHQHPVHDQHKLYLVNLTRGSGGSWRCDVCKKNSVDLGETHSYHCPICDFNMCRNCFPSVTRPLHPHCLIRTDVRNVYLQSSGAWCCDTCGFNNGPGNYYPWHCRTCLYDLCDNCCKPWKSLFHSNHQLFKADANIVYQRFNGGWRCDQCLQSFTPNNKQPYHCSQCEYDLCEDCMRNDGNPSNRVGYDVPRHFGMESVQVRTLTRGMSSTTIKGKPIASPMGDIEEEIGRSGPPDDAGECVICLDKPKDATIVHGNTGHVCCCTTCALELENKGLNCPICRAPIDRVIKQYTV